MAQAVEDDQLKLVFNLINQSTRDPRVVTAANFIWSIDAGSATDESMVLEDAAKGRVSHRFSVGDLVPGVLRADLKSTDSDDFTVIARDVIRLQIRRKIT